MSSKLLLIEMTLEQISDIAAELARRADAQQVFYFGSRRWDAPISFGMIEFVIVTPRPAFFTESVQDDLMDNLSVGFEALLTFVESADDVMSRAILVWPPKS